MREITTNESGRPDPIRSESALAGTLPAWVEGLQDYLKWSAVTFSCILGGGFAYFQMFDRKVGLEDYVKNWGAQALEKTAASRGLTRKLAAASWSWDKISLVLSTATKESLL